MRSPVVFANIFNVSWCTFIECKLPETPTNIFTTFSVSVYNVVFIVVNLEILLLASIDITPVFASIPIKELAIVRVELAILSIAFLVLLDAELIVVNKETILFVFKAILAILAVKAEI